MSEERTLLVKSRNEGTFKITIPADWKVTFSAFNQGGKYPDGENALRIYEAENKQRACFVGVQSFRDLSIPVVRLVKEQSGEERWESDGLGNEKRASTRKTRIREVKDEA